MQRHAKLSVGLEFKRKLIYMPVTVIKENFAQQAFVQSFVIYSTHGTGSFSRN
jgi:hypothetical protein